MDQNRHWVINTYNFDPTTLIDTIGESYTIYNHSDANALPEPFASSEETLNRDNTGHSLTNYFEFIINNYENLPDRIGLTKANVFPRHISKKIFQSRLQQSGFISFYGESQSFTPQYHKIFRRRLVAQQVTPGFYLEINNNWYCKTRKRGSYFPRLDDLFQYLYGRNAPRYQLFVPGACAVVEAARVRQWSKDVYYRLFEATSYDFFPVEAFHVERAFLNLFMFPRD
jgi:hypothetical protein